MTSTNSNRIRETRTLNVAAAAAACALLLAVASLANAQDMSKTWEARRARILDEYDADGDGQLSTPERETLRAALREERESGFGGRGGQSMQNYDLADESFAPPEAFAPLWGASAG